MLKIVKFFLLLLISTTAVARQLHGEIQDQTSLFAMNSSLQEVPAFVFAQGNPDSFPVKQYIIKGCFVVIKIKDTSEFILGRGVLDLESYNPADGMFKYKFTIDNLAFSKSTDSGHEEIFHTCERETTDIPIHGTLHFDVDNNTYTMIEGRYDKLTKNIAPIKSINGISLKSTKELLSSGVEFKMEKDIPVTIDIE
ncbi:MAG: hypothetical protein EPO11_06850 [Gammaproteobacteria bacterium]|nr:MAG: hypothetical protein EPO11_06850 [Gammaproteobacteria bacterium]